MKTTCGRSILGLGFGACVLLGLGLLMRGQGGREHMRVATETPGARQAPAAAPVAEVPRPETAGVASASDTATTPEFDADRPDPFDDVQLDRWLARMDRDRLYRAQDAAMATWPKYAAVRETLYQELAVELDLEHRPTDRLVALALKLRDQFWNEGGNSSTSSYAQAYKARILLELAHKREPGDMTITDELVETIQAAWVWWRFQGDDRIRTAENVKELLDLRLEQCQRISGEVEKGRTPTWDDFVRANDLAWLLHRAKQPKAAEKVVDWLLQEADKGGWSAYRHPLEGWKRHLQAGTQAYVYRLYATTNSRRLAEVPYDRRLPSFRGPNPEQRGLAPRHLVQATLRWQEGPMK